ncbi:DUF1800 domain-containing protein [Photobacterium leiognathi subsp. mandapamensis]
MSYYPTPSIITEQRFGFGPRLNTHNVAVLPLADQLHAKPYLDPTIQALPSTDQVLAQIGQYNQQRKKLKKSPEQKRAVQKQVNQFFQQSYQQQVSARNLQTLHSPYGFQEQLIQFWSNHFAVSADTRKVKPIIVGIENEVIRRHWHGNFNDMLQATIKHPTMLMFLDNNLSIGPDSKLGKKRQKGLNENLAREIMELHTLGVNGGYDQQDVIQLAHAITGWQVSFDDKNPGFKFASWAHQPGTVTLLDQRFPQTGIKQGQACLKMLALHPQTAKHLATKLAQHFIGTTKTSVINDLAAVYLKNNGNLLPVYQRLLQEPEVNVSQPVRFRTPQEWLFALLRSADVTPPANKITSQLRLLGQQPFMAGSPAGWSDQDSDYNSSSALMQRWQIANMYAVQAVKHARQQKIKPNHFVRTVTANLYGSALDQHTELAMNKADGAISKLVMLWLSPQFMYR